MTIIHYIASPFWGGGEQYIYTLAQQLIAVYHYRIIFVCQPGTSQQMCDKFATLGPIYLLKPSTRNGKFSFMTAMRLANIARKEHASILHIHELKEIFIGVYAKIFCRGHLRLIATRHIVGPAKSKITWLWAYRHIDTMIFVSQLVANTFLCQPSVKRALPRTHVIHNSVAHHDDTDHTPIDIRRQYQLPSHAKIVCFHGRICAEKGIMQLLPELSSTMERIPLYILIAGAISDTDRAAWELLMQTLPFKDKIIFVGFRTDILRLIGQCDIGIVPSVVAEAGGPLALLEYMLIGCAIIASDNGSEPEYLRRGIDGILCPPTDYEAWRKAIGYLATNDKERATFTKNAQHHFQETFSYPIFLQKIHNLYEHIITK